MLYIFQMTYTMILTGARYVNSYLIYKGTLGNKLVYHSKVPEKSYVVFKSLSRDPKTTAFD